MKKWILATVAMLVAAAFSCPVMSADSPILVLTDRIKTAPIAADRKFAIDTLAGQALLNGWKIAEPAMATLYIAEGEDPDSSVRAAATAAIRNIGVHKEWIAIYESLASADHPNVLPGAIRIVMGLSSNMSATELQQNEVLKVTTVALCTGDHRGKTLTWFDDTLQFLDGLLVRVMPAGVPYPPNETSQCLLSLYQQIRDDRFNPDPADGYNRRGRIIALIKKFKDGWEQVTRLAVEDHDYHALLFTHPKFGQVWPGPLTLAEQNAVIDNRTPELIKRYDTDPKTDGCYNRAWMAVIAKGLGIRAVRAMESRLRTVMAEPLNIYKTIDCGQATAKDTLSILP
jgi:hypothetical protein